MAAHHRVHDYACCHPQADCLESGISSGPLRSITSMGNLYPYLYQKLTDIGLDLSLIRKYNIPIVQVFLRHCINTGMYCRLSQMHTVCTWIKKFGMNLNSSDQTDFWTKMAKLLAKNLFWLSLQVCSVHCIPADLSYCFIYYLL